MREDCPGSSAFGLASIDIVGEKKSVVGSCLMLQGIAKIPTPPLFHARFAAYLAAIRLMIVVISTP